MRSSHGPSRGGATLRALWLGAWFGSLWLAYQPAAGAAPPMQFARLSGDKGLSAGGVMAIAQDDQGFIWLGTEDGLDRYDGYELRHHQHDRSRPGSLPNNWVSALAADGHGVLWIGTDGGGVVTLNPRTGAFEEIPPLGGHAAVGAQASVRVVDFDRHGRLWVGTRESGLVVLDRAHNTIQRLRHADDDAATLSSDSVFSVAEESSGVIWIGTGGGLDRFDPVTGHVERQAARLAVVPGMSRGDVAVNALLVDSHGDLWIGTNAGLIRREARTGAFESYRNRPGDGFSLPADRVQAIFEDHARRLWVGTVAGLAHYEPQGNRFATYRHDPADATTLPDDNVISLHEDRGGLLWVGTKAGGVARWNSRSWSFGHQASGAADGLAAGNVAAFAEDSKGTLWIANLGAGLEALDRLHGTVTRYQHVAADPTSLPDDRVTALQFDGQGALWVGTMTAGLAKLDPETRRFTSYRYDAHDPYSLGAMGVMSLLADSHGRIWAGTYDGGLSLLDAATARFARFVADPADAATLSSDRVTALAEDRSGRIWVGTDGGGLCLLDPITGRVMRYLHDARNPHSLSANTVYAIRVDERGRVWVGTRGGGMDAVVGSALEPETLRFRNFSTAEGLPNTTIYGIEPDAGGRLWLSTNRGLARFDPAGNAVRNFLRAQGLQGDEFNFGAHYRSPKGELFFGGPNGYNAFFPETLQFDATPPPLALTAFLKLNKPALTPVPHERLSSIELDYRDDVVTFDFAALDYASPEDNRYRYRLEGFDPDWVDAGSEHRATYTNLGGGRYTFRVRAANSDGTWNEAGLAIPLSVKPPPWATPWAYGAYFAGFVALIFAVWNSQHQKLRREARYAHQLEQNVRDRTDELAQRNAELERVNQQLQEASITDPLTALGNRRFLCDAVAALLETARGASKPPTLSLFIVDLDHLKPVNDVHGHEAGDQMLLKMAEILRRSCRSTDFIARWGGDEFVIVYRDEDLAAAEVLAERIRSRVAKQIFRVGDGKAVRTSCSIGFSRYPFVHEAPDMLRWEQCLAVADAALYHAKKERNGWIGWAGTAAAAGMPSLVGLLERDPESLEHDGRLEVRRPRFRPEDTVDEINLRHRRRSDP